MTPLDVFARQQFLNLETFRKNGTPVRTPVWFTQEGDSIFVKTAVSTGKVKRIHNNPRVNLAPCKMDGTLLGEWVPAEAREVTDEETLRRVDRLMDRKYGLMIKLFSLAKKAKSLQNTVFEIKAAG